MIKQLETIPVTDDSDKQLWAGILSLIERAEKEGCHDIFVGIPSDNGSLETTLHRAAIESLGEDEVVIALGDDPEETMREIFTTLGRDQQVELREEGRTMFILDEETPGMDWSVEIFNSEAGGTAHIRCPEVFDQLIERAKRINKIID